MTVVTNQKYDFTNNTERNISLISRVKPPKITITSLVPQKALRGDKVTIQGTNLGTGISSAIFINDQSVDLSNTNLNGQNHFYTNREPCSQNGTTITATYHYSQKSISGTVTVIVNPDNTVDFTFDEEYRSSIQLSNTKITGKFPLYNGDPSSASTTYQTPFSAKAIKTDSAASVTKFTNGDVFTGISTGFNPNPATDYKGFIILYH
ncbi:MAG: hypothetical protein WCL14_14930 [Bacteroidota bacterium]